MSRAAREPPGGHEGAGARHREEGPTHSEIAKEARVSVYVVRQHTLVDPSLIEELCSKVCSLFSRILAVQSLQKPATQCDSTVVDVNDQVKCMSSIF